jgi:hypothetical protein
VPQKPNRQQRFLIVRHRSYRRFFFSIILRWLQANFPQLSSHFEVRDLPIRVKDWSRYALHTAWLQDPVQRWSLKTYHQATTLNALCDQRGIPVINRVDRLINATKSRGAELMKEAGIRVARMARIENATEFQNSLLGLRLPLFIREDWGHDRRMFRVDTEEQLPQIPWQRFKRPVAVELVDVRSPSDGLYRKFRFVAAGDLGICHHLHVSRGWVTRGEDRVMNSQTRDEELQYISQPDANHEVFQRARQALGLELAAFDYGYTPDRKMIVWEANPFPHLLFATKRLQYKNPAMHRTLLAVVHLYFTAAGLPAPPDILEGLALDFDALHRRFQIVRKTNLLDRLLALPAAFPHWPA